jgi:ABC-type tungstate transport system substrate-binding protein
MSNPFDFLFSLGAIGGIAGVILGSLYLFFPLIVMMQLGHIKKRIDQSTSLSTSQNAALLQAQTATVAELKVQNDLTRQLLRAYGHDPEV